MQYSEDPKLDKQLFMATAIATGAGLGLATPYLSNKIIAATSKDGRAIDAVYRNEGIKDVLTNPGRFYNDASKHSGEIYKLRDSRDKFIADLSKLEKLKFNRESLKKIKETKNSLKQLSKQNEQLKTKLKVEDVYRRGTQLQGGAGALKSSAGHAFTSGIISNYYYDAKHKQ